MKVQFCTLYGGNYAHVGLQNVKSVCTATRATSLNYLFGYQVLKIILPYNNRT